MNILWDIRIQSILFGTESSGFHVHGACEKVNAGNSSGVTKLQESATADKPSQEAPHKKNNNKKGDDDK